MIRVEASGSSLRSRDEFIPTQTCPTSQPLLSCSVAQEPPRKYFDTHELFVCVYVFHSVQCSLELVAILLPQILECWNNTSESCYA